MGVNVGNLNYPIMGKTATVTKDPNGNPMPCFARDELGTMSWQAMMSSASTDQEILDAADAYLSGTLGWC